MLAIVSGGLDSVTMLYNFKDVITHVLYFNYGSKHAERESYYSEYHAKLLNKNFYKFNLDLASFFKSALLSGQGEIPDGHYEDVIMKQTVVPFRNAIMLSLAVGYAESLGLKEVYIANHFGDHTIYPDCRLDFIKAFNEASKFGTYGQVEIVSPYVNVLKRNIALAASVLGVEVDKTYSCYKGRQHHCGTCGTCVERKEALLGFDTTVYESHK